MPTPDASSLEAATHPGSSLPRCIPHCKCSGQRRTAPVAAVIGTGALCTVGSGEALVAHALAVHAAALAMTVAGTPALCAVRPGEALEAHALAVHTAPAAVAVVQTQGLPAVLSREALLAHAAAVHAAAMLLAAGHWACLLAAVEPGVAFEADTGPVHALALVIAVAGTGQQATVLAGEALITHALAVQTLAAQVTVPRALGLRAVGAFPAGFAHATAAFRAEVAPAAAEGPGVHAACREKKRVSL